jgi:transcription elongation factor Elf1
MDPSLNDTALRFECPRCGHEESDDYEVVDVGIPTAWRCSGCSRPFSVMLLECHDCGAERVESALQASEHSAIEHIHCGQCGCGLLRHEETDESIASF